ADIGGQLACSNGTFENEEGYALCADGLKTGGDVFFNEGFRAVGEVRLPGADIGGNLECRGGTFENEKGYALCADRLKTGGDVFFDEGFRAKGEVRLHGADIGGQLSCRDGTFENEKGKALNADGLKTGGNVFLDKGFRARGEVKLLGADIGGQLSCRDGTFENEEGFALNAEGMNVKGVFFWLLREKPSGTVDLVNARVGHLEDDKRSWPGKGKLHLDGFEYSSLRMDEKTMNVEDRLEWLRLQIPEKSSVAFKPRPYEQLAKILHQMGHESDARRVRVEKQEDLRRYGGLSRKAKAWNWFLGFTIGHGWRPWRVFSYFIVPIVLFGLFAFWCADRLDVMQPSRERVYMSPEFKVHKIIPPEYPVFQPFVYSLDTFVPFVNLHQEDYWLPDSNKSWGWLFRVYLWLHILSGWVLSTLAAVSVTGLVRKE
ncbi:MAG TPA: hypothetical protein VJM57_01865, partial [Thermodesulfobacteriota bacterium]|nr:hypothetical protein [Thermodesulfobacteriota bacterium]